MTLTDEQAKIIKEQIFKQLENFPEDKRESAKNHIESLNNEQLEEFIIKNKLIKQTEGDESGTEKGEKQCIMCLISEKKINSFSIYEDKNYLAVLEINPLSEGHTLIIPKKHVSKIADIPKSYEKVSKRIIKHLTKKLKPKEIRISPSDELGHAIINLIPVYDGIEIKNRKSPKPEELAKIKEKIGEVKRNKEKEAKKGEVKPKPAEIIKIQRRIP
jgi:histidine triad (HIT) family protein